MVNKIIKEMIFYFKQDVKRINHAIKVMSFAETISSFEKLSAEKLFVVRISSILHDIGIKEAEKKYNSSAGNFQEIEGPVVASNILKYYEIENDLLDRILFLIGNHHSYNKIDKIDFQILVEADFIVNIYEDNYSNESISTIKSKYFRTKIGSEIIESMYGV